MARVLLKGLVKDRGGAVLENARVYVREQGTEDPVTDLFAAESGGSAITAELLSNSQGEVQGWLSSGRYVDLYVTDNSGAAYYPSSSNVPRTFTPFTETMAVGPRPDQVASVTDHGALTGLDDDDHPQYHNDARGDARYDPLGAAAARQAHDTDLDTIAALDSSQSGVIASDGAGWFRKTYAALKTALGIVKADLPASIAYEDEENTFSESQNIDGSLDVTEHLKAHGGNAYVVAEEATGSPANQGARFDAGNAGFIRPSLSLFDEAMWSELKLSDTGFATEQTIEAAGMTVGGEAVALQDAVDAEATSRADADALKAGLADANVFTQINTVKALAASGLTGATAASRYVGATSVGAPLSGTFAIGDWVIDQTGVIYVCTIAGSPGTWKDLTSVSEPRLTSLWLGSDRFGITAGTPVIAATNGWTYWAMDAAAVESVGTEIVFPSHWTTYHADLYWTRTAAGTGNVVWQSSYGSVGSGDDIGTALSSGTATTASVPTANIVKVTSLLTSIATPTVGKITTQRILRAATNGNDTFASDAHILGLLLTKAS